MTRKHAKLSASGSAKWLVCTPSAHLEDQFPDEGSDFASEGSFAHSVFEQEMLDYLGRAVNPLHKNQADRYDSHALRDYVAMAKYHAIEAIEDARARCNDPIVLVEQRLDFSPWVNEGFGTGDLVIIADDLVQILDLKYGKGVFVEAENNSQMRLYGLGAYHELAHLYDIRRVRMTVLQPRLGNFGSEELPIKDLLDWARDDVVPKAQLAWEGEGGFVPGEHCKSAFCKARFTCQARAQQAIAIAQQEFAPTPPKPESLSVERIAEILPQADLVIDWFTELKAHALRQVTEKGVKIPGFKLVCGRSVRKYKNPEAVAAKLREAEVPEDMIFERSLIGITAMEKMLGKNVFAEVLGDLVSRPEGKPTLAPESDKRPAIASAASAAEDFKPV